MTLQGGVYLKLKIVIDKERTEEVIIYAHEKTKLVEDIERLVEESTARLIGYKDKAVVPLTAADVHCFIAENNKIYALRGDEKLQLKCRLYNIEENLTDNFVKINQSCIANIKMIERFDASISGSLRVKFKNGYTDYVSRRQLKTVKERLGI